MPPFVGIGTDRNRLRPSFIIAADSSVVVKRTHGIGKHIRHTFHSKLRCNLCGGLACVETIVVVAFMDRGFQRVPAGHVYAKGFPVDGQLVVLDGILCALLVDRNLCGFRRNILDIITFHNRPPCNLDLYSFFPYNKNNGGGKMANNDQLWQEAKKRCRLDDKDIALAKRLGLNPRSLIKNIPNKSEPWKAPVKDWLHEIEAKRSKKAAQKQRRQNETKAQNSAGKEE